jgi:NAD(P)-dependent dehydrogenase (short-subunit alcohol dehydrogenase family)
VQIASFGGQVAYPGFGAYCPIKSALEGMSEALAAEVALLRRRVDCHRRLRFGLRW